MNETFPCGNAEALVTYLYDECDATEREAIEAHLSACASCAEEIVSLRETRMHLTAWTPSALPLGFQITRADGDTEAGGLWPRLIHRNAKRAAGVVGPSAGREGSVGPGASREPGRVRRSAEREAGRVHRSAEREGGWWRQPLPAWAQIAAAVLIFGAGMTLGGARQAVENAPVQARTDQPAATRQVSATAASPDELARLDARLRAVEATQTQRVSASARSAVADQDALLTRVNALIDERIAQSERRQQIENVRLLADVARGLDVQHQAALRGFDEELQETRQTLRTIVVPSLAQRVSFQPGSPSGR